MIISAELIQGCIQNERAAQKRLYTLLLPYLNAVAIRYLLNSSDVKDVLQETFINIFSNIKKYDSSKSQFKTWAVRITINCTLKYNEKMHRLPTQELSNQHQQFRDPEVLKKLSDEDVLLFLKQMPQNYFEVFNLNVIDGFSHKEIGALLKIDESLSRKRLSRAKLWLSNKLSEQRISELRLKKGI